MFGVGPQELVIIGVLFLLIFGPRKLPGMARDVGRFINGVNHTAEEFKNELAAEEVKDTHRAVKEFKDKTLRSVEEFKAEVVSGEEGDESPSKAPPDKEDQAPKPKEKKVPPHRDEAPRATRTQAKKEVQPNASPAGFSLNGSQSGTRGGGHKRTRWGRVFGRK